MEKAYGWQSPLVALELNEHCHSVQKGCLTLYYIYTESIVCVKLLIAIARKYEAYYLEFNTKKMLPMFSLSVNRGVIIR